MVLSLPFLSNIKVNHVDIFSNGFIRWLPTKEGLQQRNFTTVLKTLNTLGDVRDKTLKQVLLDLNDDLETSMDFAKEYGHVWSDFQERRGAHVRIEEDLSIIKKTKSVSFKRNNKKNY